MLQAHLPSIIRRFKTPGKRKFGVEDVKFLASRMDEYADQLRLDREQDGELLQAPVRGASLARGRLDINMVDSSRNRLAYLEVCNVPTPQPTDLRAFVHPQPQGRDLRQKSLQHTQLGKSQSLPQLSKSCMKGHNPNSTLRTTGHHVAMQMSTGSIKRVSFAS